MKTLLAAIAVIGTLNAFASSAIAEVSFTIRFGSSPQVKTYRTYRSNVYSPPVVPYYQNRGYSNYNNYNNSRGIVREVYPQVNLGNSWNYSTIPNNSYNHYYRSHRNYGDERYIVEKRIIRVR